jgi:hypothetical protein
MSGTTNGIVVFSFAAWSARYPEFSAVSVPAAQAYFDEATLYLNNTPSSRVSDVVQRALILNMITAHIASLAGQASSPDGSLVGRITSASEGSVSVGTEYKAPESAAWWVQTPYGSSAWSAMAPLRTMRWFPAPRRRW